MRIVSLVPSITELLYHLGLNDETVGITKFCVHPEHWHRTKPRVGGTKNVDIEIIKALQPTLIIASKEENIKEQVEEAAAFCEVLLTDVGNFEEALQMICTVGIHVGKPGPADQLATQINCCFNEWAPIGSATAAYLIWKDPWMTIGGDTFIHSMMQKAGFKNVMDLQFRYPEITIEQLQKIQPQFIFLSSEPYPFKEHHVVKLQNQFPFSKVMLVDGEMFSWYGSRMMQAAPYFKKLCDAVTDQ